MLTSLKVSGFKNLKDCHVMFGPFTCIAGANGAGKSNLFDVIGLLKNLVQMPLMDAFSKIRNEEGQRANNLSAAFFKTDNGDYSDLKITAEFIVKTNNTDDFNRTEAPNSNFLKYDLVIKYKPAATDVETNVTSFENIELCFEELTYVTKNDIKDKLCFKLTKSLSDFIYNKKTSKYISTKDNIINLHQDSSSTKSGKGRTFEFPAQGAIRTVLSTINSYDTPTALAAKREMQSWLRLQFEPSSLRSYDNFKDADKLDEYGKHLPGTLNRLNKNSDITNKLANLVPDILSINVDMDTTRDTKTLEVSFKHGKKFTANNLSDGTLRFMALSALVFDKHNAPVICMEEPENGIHPEKMPALVALLQDITCDLDDEINNENPLRQIIINTHSPVLVKDLVVEDLLFAENFSIGKNSFVRYLPMEKTARQNTKLGDFASMATATKYLGKNVVTKNILSSKSKSQTLEELVSQQSSLELEFEG